ncbi:unnamed protein product [Prunus armeniaca]|uniref:Uncharacterized protein n=1 Tax=Prunus armeniaca TaxID=36596 RepID=A0A6J5WWC4_PRUAR|nr:unnamed protein product [Prunus armeniaca]
MLFKSFIELCGIGGGWLVLALPEAMNLLSWNCHRLRNPSAVNGLKSIIHEEGPKIVFLCKTPCNSVHMEKLSKQLGFRGLTSVSSTGYSRGLALFWKEEVDVHLCKIGRSHGHY